MCSIAVLLGGFGYFFIIFLSFGFLMSVGFKELHRKNDYLFYSNNGVTKIQLWLFSCIFTFCTTVLTRLVLIKDGKIHTINEKEDLIEKGYLSKKLLL